MKKTIITLLALAGVASAGDTQFLDLSKDITVGNLTYTASTGKITTTTPGDLYTAPNNKAETNVIITMNLTAAMSVTTDTKIVELDYNSNKDVSLLATTTGLVGAWNGSAYGDNEVAWDNLMADSNVFTGADGNKYITLMLTQWNNNSINFHVNTSNGLLINTPSLGAGSISSMDALYVNNAFVAGLEVTPSWKDGDTNCQTATATFNAVMKQKLLVPEPATSTLSLLALAGLAARRRRK